MAAPCRSRRGVALIEVMIAITVLTIAGLSLSVWARQMTLTEARSIAREATLRAASEYLDRIAMWPREDLDRHFGTHLEGPWRIRIERVGASAYEIGLASDSGVELLHTRVYRPQTGGTP